ncbi:methyl-accepting chemotaxis sensory transducer with Pas/Pac sensor [Janthinobacterium sp. 61]|uniref:methyl-accepting chemotaxis protein n=1 Tax=Janthinobacterium sp. 61 TaxID=2035209 RepID=UPI000C70BF03|nr:PAS domain-containing methyl-accepting chemotaxis protein [Janthinobacterium sp. 61]PKV43063.1 methyl-accepting chemotaxis sensory transducer with Pas/Pac sensor [Janthinobacterium sp. 61]
MRLNLPVSDTEINLSDTETIVSTTDLQGNITYANPYFIAVSGYSGEELIGAPQNILRHPDMPVEAFADFWATIRSGRSWSGMVKNRCKNGDYYWVLANVTPVVEDGVAVGYMSVRTKPTRQQVAQASALYARIKAGQADGIVISQGAAVRTGWLAKVLSLRDLALGKRIGWNLGLLSLVLLLQLAWTVGVLPASAGGWLTGLSAVALCAALYFWHSLYRAVLQPLQQARQACDVMAGGDLTGEFDTTRRDEMGQLLRSLRQLRVNLHSIVGDVRGNFLRISMASQEIAAGNMDLSGRTEAQASALEQTASSMEQLAATVQQNSGNAVQASDMAGKVHGLAGRGGEIVGQVVSMMAEINASSKKIGDITGIIEGIAFQTNILALNAAVEAARAGDQGRGFAVVAGEVRSLAQRSASAATEIKQLITASLAQVQAGAKLAQQAGASSAEMLGAVQGVHGIMEEIASASREQSHGIGQVNMAVTQMDEVTQQNAALVEESAAASASLQDQALQLEQAMALFKLERRSRGQAGPAKPLRAPERRRATAGALTAP